jgi:serine/threonine protein kinase
MMKNKATVFPEIPGYKIIEELGKGGMARVYLGIQEKLNRKVAIKVLEPGLFQDESKIARFENEARTAAGLNHSNIITILDTGKASGYYYIVMEYLEESLRDWMDFSPSKKIPPDTAFEIVRTIMIALASAHKEGIYHRDIKPENIMFREETPVLVDFGIARVLHCTDELTGSREILGSLHYVSPEQCTGQKDIDARSDIYSLGVVLYEMLTGEKPYDDASPMAIILKHTQDPVPRLPRKLSPYQPLIEKMMAKNRKDRISNRQQFEKLLAEIQTDLVNRKSQTVKLKPDTIIAPASSLLHQSKKSKKSLYMIILLFLIVVGIFFFYFSRNRVSVSSVPVVTNSMDTFFSQDLQYHMDLSLAYIFLKSDDLWNLMTAGEITDKLESVELPSGLNRWKEDISNRLFDRYLTTAGDLFEKEKYLEAKAIISQAKRIKITAGLEELENLIDINYTKHLQQLKQEQKDDGAFDMAVSGNSIADYYKYLIRFPRGRHIKAARWKIRLLHDLARKRLKGNKLRSSYKDPLKNKEAEAMVKRYNFFESQHNPGGYFRSYSETIKEGKALLIIDYTTDLVWYNGPDPGKMDWDKAKKWIAALNAKKYGRFSDWRFPTLEEAVSLLRNRKNKKGLYIDPLFSGNQKGIWTGDRSTLVVFKGRKHWVVFFDKGIFEKSYKDNELNVLAVRSLK